MPLAAVTFLLLGFVVKLPFLEQIDVARLVEASAKKAFTAIGAEAFVRSNYLMLAVFAAAIILWMTDALPNYLTSLIVIVGLVLTGVLSEKVAYAQLGHPVMWLNIMSFVLASMLVDDRAGQAVRLVVHPQVREERAPRSSSASSSSTWSCRPSSRRPRPRRPSSCPSSWSSRRSTARTAGDGKTNFGRKHRPAEPAQHQSRRRGVRHRIRGEPAGRGADRRGHRRAACSSADWMMAMFPMIDRPDVHRLSPGHEGVLPPGAGASGSRRSRAAWTGCAQELRRLGRLDLQEVKSAHHLHPDPRVSGPRTACTGSARRPSRSSGPSSPSCRASASCKWNDVDIPWHLMLFSAGAYTLGAGLDASPTCPRSASTPSSTTSASASRPRSGSLYLVLTGGHDLQRAHFPVQDHAGHDLRPHRHRRGRTGSAIR
ncbi:MAG: hypothetical protein M0C28_45655 [Candidatus Moduliflexus flocculans]|nr:hypothetical protein [Candidatus Moduliflexus flocculans]